MYCAVSFINFIFLILIFTKFGSVCIIIIIIAILPMQFVDITCFQSLSFVVRFLT